MLRAALAALAFALALGTASPVSAPAATSPSRVAILLFHHVAAPPAGADRALYVPPATFRRQLAALHRAGFTAVTLDRVWGAWHGGRALPRRSVVLSFDDGYADQARAAAPVLRSLGWPGVLNLALAFLGRDDGGITRPQVRRLLRDGWTVDAHSLTHGDLTELDPGRLRTEVAGSRRAIRRAFGRTPSFFCYPFGRVDARVEAAVKAAGYRGATTTRRGAATPRQDPYLLRRTVVTARTTPAEVVALARG